MGGGDAEGQLGKIARRMKRRWDALAGEKRKGKNKQIIILGTHRALYCKYSRDQVHVTWTTSRTDIWKKRESEE